MSIGNELIPTLKHEGKKFEMRKEIVNTATKYFKTLYTNVNYDPSTYEKKQCKDVEPFMVGEIISAISKLKNEKASGPDDIYNEIIKYSSYELHKVIKHLFNNILKEEVVPKQWHVSNITILHKKGSKDNLDNYRPINLSSGLYKLFMIVLRRRIEKTLDEQQSVEQAGFRPTFSIMDHIRSVTQIIEKCMEYGYTVYLTFIDFTKGVDQKYINILKYIYRNSKARIRTDQMGEPKGVKQGDPITPILFNEVSENIFRNMSW
ncbi:unnamed protein product [Parnassius mnemosyne]|uniref:Reverse transcriptase domain-containing protein n=1 Tax=Parnassius mnemosyne TaxID=213953 RepID=A0AAV1LLH0_9NEOP